MPSRFVALLLIAVAGFAQSVDESAYNSLVNRAKKGDTSVDFRELRFSCLKLANCAIRSTPTELAELAAIRDPREVIKKCDELLSRGFANIELHATRAGAYQQLGDASEAAKALALVTGMVGSILRGKDGKTPDTSYEVVSDREEYVVLSMLGLQYRSPSTKFAREVKDSHKFDRWDVNKTPDGPAVTLYYNTDSFAAKSVANGKP